LRNSFCGMTVTLATVAELLPRTCTLHDGMRMTIRVRR